MSIPQLPGLLPFYMENVAKFATKVVSVNWAELGSAFTKTLRHWLCTV